MINAGDAVYLIYVGIITVESVSEDGDITFYLTDNDVASETLQTVSRAMYRTMDNVKDIRHHTRYIDCTTEARRQG